MNRLTIVTGLSGSGKSVALHTLEDEGFYCIDNLPSSMVHDLLDKELGGKDQFKKLAIGIDMRGEHGSSDEFLSVLKSLHARKDFKTDVLFLDTSRATLSTRFSETRRKHPLSSNDVTLMHAIDMEARLLTGVKDEADLVIDTSLLNLHQLRDIISTEVLGNSASGSLALTFQSFGFKHGQPASTDFMFDVRCLPNPYWEPTLREYTGKDGPIVEFLGKQEQVLEMYSDIRFFVERWLPRFEIENRSYLTVSIGCTGGRHRSVYLCELLAAHFKSNRDNVALRHRQLS